MFCVLSIVNIIATLRTSTNACMRVHIFENWKKQCRKSWYFLAYLWRTRQKCQNSSEMYTVQNIEYAWLIVIETNIWLNESLMIQHCFTTLLILNCVYNLNGGVLTINRKIHYFSVYTLHSSECLFYKEIYCIALIQSSIILNNYRLSA